MQPGKAHPGTGNEVLQVTPLPVTPASHMNYSPCYSTPDPTPCLCAGESGKGWPMCLGPRTRGKDLRKSHPWLLCGLALTLWPFEERARRWKISLSVSPFLSVTWTLESKKERKKILREANILAVLFGTWVTPIKYSTISSEELAVFSWYANEEYLLSTGYHKSTSKFCVEPACLNETWHWPSGFLGNRLGGKKLYMIGLWKEMSKLTLSTTSPPGGLEVPLHSLLWPCVPGPVPLLVYPVFNTTFSHSHLLSLLWLSVALVTSWHYSGYLFITVYLLSILDCTLCKVRYFLNSLIFHQFLE